MRDGFYLLVIEGILIYMLGMPLFTPGMVFILLAAYATYATHVMYDSKNSGEVNEPYDGKINSPVKACGYMTAAMLLLGVLCHYLAVSIESIAHAFEWPVYIVAVVLGAAATSLPDTILSVKSAKKGEYEDAVGNAIGSNIFDVTGALAIPMLVAMIFSGFEPLPIEQSAGLFGLRIFVWGTSAIVVGALLTFANNINKYMAWFLFLLYTVWVGYLFI